MKLVYENRGEKLGVAKLDLNDKIAEVIDKAGLGVDEAAHLQKLLGKDYEVVTAGERLEKLAADFVNHCAARWESGKFMLVCIDKITCGRMFNLIMPHWLAKTAEVKAEGSAEAGRRRRAESQRMADCRARRNGWQKPSSKSSSARSKSEVEGLSRSGTWTSSRTASG